ncbi:putative bifunctional diguanylate cyclase/phosphodiesterase [Thioalkalivibrio thiocyanoxidans]|uniref:putative bifunctional diguanylate cyclase/phosphodiesterase n=1 Tax=Thioalkalivibrio thiocyanoxidans TaxID=152475 RepID=UPI0003658ECB|nr:EAL domain-containing protein [Thioalkalivibrio thiocyanoxidans]
MSRSDSAPLQANGSWYSEYLARTTLRSWVGMSFVSATLIIVGGLLLSWLIPYLAGGADRIVPHLYYVPILFAAARFGPGAALIVALVAGVLAGPLTYVDVATATAQETERWLTRTAFFVGIGQLMAWLVIPALRPVTEELRRMRQEFDIRRGLKHNEFFLRYQPIYSIRQRRFVGVEALIRWQHPVHGELTPADFLDVAEDSSLIHDIGELVVAEACRQTEEWKNHAQAQGREPWYTAINLSARDLIRPELAYDVARALKRHHLPPDLLTIELTETVLVLEDAKPALAALKHLGVHLAIDDFGTGYSSLAYLNRFPIDTLKLDRQLVSNLGHDPSAADLARGIALLAGSLGLTTVAEGIETRHQIELSRELGFDRIQGFYFARPLQADEVPSLLLLEAVDPDNPPTPRSSPHTMNPSGQSLRRGPGR